MAKYHQGLYPPTNPEKYMGDPTKIAYRSQWEFAYMRTLDRDPNVIAWGSEEIIVPYRSPKDNKIHRYFPDFLVKEKQKDGTIKTTMVEIKPLKETKPPQVKKKPTKGYLNEVVTWGVNSSKWEAAEAFCKKRGWDFVIMTEVELFGRK